MLRSMRTPIGHLDADCFYASAERVRYDYLRGQPVGVLGNQGACVIAKSYELKARGVSTGQPIWEAVPLCPEAIFVKRDFRWYEVLSRMMLAILREVSPVVEYYSIDEFFFDAAWLPRVFAADFPAATAALQQRILLEVGVPVSIGVSTSRTLAKLGSDINKPFGIGILFGPEQIREFLDRQDVGEISGIGRKSVAKLHAIGIRTCLDLAEADRHQIRKLLTITGEAIWYELHGEPVIPIQTERKRKQRISRGGSLGETTSDPARINAWLTRNMERVVEEIDRLDLDCGRLTVCLMHKDWPATARAARLDQPTSAFESLLTAGQSLIRNCHGSVYRMHVDVDLLTARGRRQGVLFSNPDASPVDTLKQRVNAKLGRFALRSAATLPLAEIYADETNDHDICDVHGKTCF